VSARTELSRSRLSLEADSVTNDITVARLQVVKILNIVSVTFAGECLELFEFIFFLEIGILPIFLNIISFL